MTRLVIFNAFPLLIDSTEIGRATRQNEARWLYATGSVGTAASFDPSKSIDLRPNLLPAGLGTPPLNSDKHVLWLRRVLIFSSAIIFTSLLQ